MNRKWLGVLFVVIGGISLLSNLGFYSGEFTLLIVGGLLLFMYYRSGDSVYLRNQGLMIAGAIVTMVGAFNILEENFALGDQEGYLFFIFLGIAFFLVFFVHTRHLNSLPVGKRRWPLYPAVALWGFGLFVFLVEFLERDLAEKILSNVFPVALIIIGVVMIGKAFRKNA